MNLIDLLRIKKMAGLIYKRWRPRHEQSEVLRRLDIITRKVDKMADSLQTRFDNLNANLEEASTEILAELTKLREGGNLTPEQEASLVKIEEKANALKDTSPPVA